MSPMENETVIIQYFFFSGIIVKIGLCKCLEDYCIYNVIVSI